MFGLILLLHSVSLSWVQNTTPAAAMPLAHNTVACGKKSGGPYTAFTYTSQTPITSFSRSPVPKGTYYCVVTETNAKGKTSAMSSETKAVVP